MNISCFEDLGVRFKLSSVEEIGNISAPGRGIIDCIRFGQHLCLNAVLLKITILRL